MQADTRESESHDIGAWKQHLGNWGAYAAAAGAALAMSTNASASIISSIPGLTVSLTPGPATTVFRVGGIGEVLSVVDRKLTANRRTSHEAEVGPASLGPHLNFKVSSSGAAHYVAGQPILAAGSVSSSADLWRIINSTRRGRTIGISGNFGPGFSNGFVGFENAAGDLGWLQVHVALDGRIPVGAELIAWAYNDVAGAPINAGQTTTPEPSTAALGLLALGAAGILALRKRRNQVSEVTQR
jgi:LPXTG-motif cell wall-anchored protein